MRRTFRASPPRGSDRNACRDSTRAFPLRSLLASNCNAHRRSSRRDAGPRPRPGKKEAARQAFREALKGEQGAEGLFRGFDLGTRAVRTVQHRTYYTESTRFTHYTKGLILTRRPHTARTTFPSSTGQTPKQGVDGARRSRGKPNDEVLGSADHARAATKGARHPENGKTLGQRENRGSCVRR